MLDNGPHSLTTLRLQARKSFVLGLWLVDRRERPLDITDDVSLTLVMRKPRFPWSQSDDSGNLIANSVAEITHPEEGFARFALQADDLNHKPGEYEYTITMNFDGYSTALVNGIIDLRQNTEYDSVAATYQDDPADPLQALKVKLRGRHVIKVTTGPTLAPGMQHFTDADKAKLDSIEEGAQRNVAQHVPDGGSKGAVLTKASNLDYDLTWQQPRGGGGGGGLDADGIPSGYAPVADGHDGWDWQEVAINVNADDIIDGIEKVAMTVEERSKLSDLTKDYEELDNLPELGTAAAMDADAFLPAPGIDGSQVLTGTVSEQRLPRVINHLGISFGTASPTGGQDGDLYFQYEA